MKARVFWLKLVGDSEGDEPKICTGSPVLSSQLIDLSHLYRILEILRAVCGVQFTVPTTGTLSVLKELQLSF